MIVVVLVVTAWSIATQPCIAADPESRTSFHRVVLENNGLLTHPTLRGLHRHFDLDRDGRVPLAELLEFASAIQHVVARRQVPSLLESYDDSRDGKLSLAEVLRQVDLVGGGDPIEQSDVEARKSTERRKFELADLDGSGDLDDEEAVALFFPETQEDVMTLVTQVSLHARDSSGDGFLSPEEFWEVDANPHDRSDLTSEELADFRGLDRDGDGKLSLPELLAWESGDFHAREALRSIVAAADGDGDGSLSAAELLAARESIAAGDAQHFFYDWAQHLEL